ncbi:hypothetical protein COCSADRAFT_277166 [Bipolaris sorokiniana ND90Pr]|uniref:Secreted protein n=1 Tax=Cochliobolus sativus (strain ND90Pr / ATCC 201652) TaxID=665912 RepID=M2TJE7_COCSN|nr:uncharacterized protein COCSADRAFT_277166 [Bipolaris sorokiniana ND90Pr]EMD68832.1 hypothetical protein COCSADRAFT_277166 [Bipolaris sorokiniana ND90Pr]
MMRALLFLYTLLKSASAYVVLFNLDTRNLIPMTYSALLVDPHLANNIHFSQKKRSNPQYPTRNKTHLPSRDEGKTLLRCRPPDLSQLRPIRKQPSRVQG